MRDNAPHRRVEKVLRELLPRSCESCFQEVVKGETVATSAPVIAAKG